jgi:sugar phosphate isomerase/epimerase
MKLGSVGGLVIPAAGADPILGRIDKAVELGISVISIGFREWGEREPDYLKRVGEYAAKRGIELRLGNGGRFGSANPAERKADVDRLTEDLLHVNKYAGIKFSSLANQPMPHNRWAPDPPMNERIDIIGENLAKLADNVRSAGITLGLENHCDYRGWECAAMLAKANRPNMMAQIDTGNAFVVFEEPVDCAKAMAKWVVSAHLKDIKVTPLAGEPWYGTRTATVPLGQGDVDNVTICAILQAESPDPSMLALMVEPLLTSQIPDRDVHLRESIAWAKAKLAKYLD